MITLARLAEEILKILSSGEIQNASNVSLAEIKIAIGQCINTRLKAEQFNVNEALGERIPNGTMLGLYEDIAVTSFNGKSKATLPIKPVKLLRNMGVCAIYPQYTADGNYELDKEFIPVQMGQNALLKSQKMLNDLLGQIGYEVFGGDVIFSKDIKALFPEITLAMRLVVMDISQYGDYDPLPILPEWEWDIKKEVLAVFGAEGIPDYTVDSSTKAQQNVPIQQQKQA